jgi:hypothetical protein
MPERLTVKRPHPVSSPVAFTVGVPLALVFVWFFGLLDKKQDIHFTYPWLNLAVHSALIVGPLLLSLAISWPKIEFEETGEAILGSSGYVNTFRLSWWTFLLMWPSSIFAVYELARVVFTQYLPHPETLSTPPLKALGIMAVALGVCML